MGSMPPPGMGGPGIFDEGFTNLPDTLDFDPTTFRPNEGDLNFERDFGQWFNPDDAVGGPSGGGGMPPSGMGGPSDMGMFDGDRGDLNFERDFGQWFNPDDAVSKGLDGMK